MNEEDKVILRQSVQDLFDKKTLTEAQQYAEHWAWMWEQVGYSERAAYVREVAAECTKAAMGVPLRPE